MPLKLSACTSLIQSGGNGLNAAAAPLVAPGVARGEFLELAAQLPTRQLSWCESMSSKEAPEPLASRGQGRESRERNLATTWSLVLGCSRDSVSPSVWSVPL